MKLDLEFEGITKEQKEKYELIFRLLFDKGALDGVRNGKVLLHFDGKCDFQGIEFAYFPWRKERILQGN